MSIYNIMNGWLIATTGLLAVFLFGIYIFKDDDDWTRAYLTMGVLGIYIIAVSMLSSIF